MRMQNVSRIGKYCPAKMAPCEDYRRQNATFTLIETVWYLNK